MDCKQAPQWEGFRGGQWQRTVDVRSFIQKNLTPYTGDEGFLTGPTERTKKVWKQCEELLLQELHQGILDVETHIVSGIDNFAPGYIDKENEVIVGLQTDAPLKRIVNLYGGTRMAKSALEQYGYQLDPEISAHFSEYRKTHNEGVFDAYPKRTRDARHAGLLTGLPDAYGRGRIIGDYRPRVPSTASTVSSPGSSRISRNWTAPWTRTASACGKKWPNRSGPVGKMKAMAARYGVDLSQPAANAREAVQFLYRRIWPVSRKHGAALLWAAPPPSWTSTFSGIWTGYPYRRRRPGAHGSIHHQAAAGAPPPHAGVQRTLRRDPTWVTESIGGMGINGRTLVTKNSFRCLHTLTNLGSAPEPNLTVLWSEHLPEAFKRYCAKMSIATDSIQYENDDVMRPVYGDDYAIACCVSAMQVGKQMQFFGARCNIAKCLLYAINGGVDERTGETVVPGIRPILDEVLSYEAVRANYEQVLSYAAELYADTVNIIHYMHDKYAYEASQMALHDTQVERLTAFGIAGLSVAADSLSAIRYASVRPVRNEAGVAVEFETEGDFPKYGNDDDRADDEAVFVVRTFIRELKKHPLYRGAKHTLSALTITSNVMYGKKTGSTPDGRKLGEPLAPGANPMHGRDENGALASLNSVAKIPYRNVCQDGVSNTFSIVPHALGRDQGSGRPIWWPFWTATSARGAHHLNVNVMDRATLEDAMEHPEKYPSLTIRVSGYAVNFNRLSREQQEEVIKRTFHCAL